MVCKRCGKEHDGSFGSGVFCCRSCANARSFSEETNKLKSTKVKEFFESHPRAKYDPSNLTEEARQKIAEGQRRGLDASRKNKLLATTEKYEALFAGQVIDSVSPRLLRRELIKRIGCLCTKCGQEPFWNGEPLTLEVDHIDGDSTNNKIDNLQLLCPNCHSQTPTYRAKNKGKSTREYTMVPKQRGVSQRSSKP